MNRGNRRGGQRVSERESATERVSEREGLQRGFQRFLQGFRGFAEVLQRFSEALPESQRPSQRQIFPLRGSQSCCP